MKILMLGWEYPPHIAGGLGTACEGLTAALSKQGLQIHFVVPQLFGGEAAQHMRLTDSSLRSPSHVASESQESPGHGEQQRSALSQQTTITKIPAFLTPYWNPTHFKEAIAALTKQELASLPSALRDDPLAQALIDGEVFGFELHTALGLHEQIEQFSDLRAPANQYGESIFKEVERFTAQVLVELKDASFDIIHAHDWMTFPAAVALAQSSKKPLVVHVHSLEHDRSGLFINEQIHDIESFGMQAADHIIAVSHYTQRSIERHHKILRSKISVVHNGVYPRRGIQDYRLHKTWPRNVVLFLGRVTFQKGPDYFVEVASRVIPHVPDLLFVVAGSGDMLPRIKERVRTLRLDEYFLFPGFVQGDELEEMFSVATLYVMPSVSEPFGISALEAISFDVPVIMSKQSGVSEVIENALKVDFWNTESMADMIINALLHDELRRDLVEGARAEVRQLHWDAAARRTSEVYQQVRR
jgi:glycosyltransferase involved in cell wall biosynthesis